MKIKNLILRLLIFTKEIFHLKFFYYAIIIHSSLKILRLKHFRYYYYYYIYFSMTSTNRSLLNLTFHKAFWSLIHHTHIKPPFINIKLPTNFINQISSSFKFFISESTSLFNQILNAPPITKIISNSLTNLTKSLKST